MDTWELVELYSPQLKPNQLNATRKMVEKLCKKRIWKVEIFREQQEQACITKELDKYQTGTGALCEFCLLSRMHCDPSNYSKRHRITRPATGCLKCTYLSQPIFWLFISVKAARFGRAILQKTKKNLPRFLRILSHKQCGLSRGEGIDRVRVSAERLHNQSNKRLMCLGSEKHSVILSCPLK